MYGLSISMPLFVRNTFPGRGAARREGGRAGNRGGPRAREDRTRLVARADRTRADYTTVRDAWLRWHRSWPPTSTSARPCSSGCGALANPRRRTTCCNWTRRSTPRSRAPRLDGRLWITCTDYLAATGQLEGPARRRRGHRKLNDEQSATDTGCRWTGSAARRRGLLQRATACRRRRRRGRARGSCRRTRGRGG